MLKMNSFMIDQSMKEKAAGGFRQSILIRNAFFCEICILCELLTHFLLKISG